MNYIGVIISPFDVSPIVNKFLMLLVQVLECPQDGRTPFVSGKLHLQSNNCTPEASMVS